MIICSLHINFKFAVVSANYDFKSHLYLNTTFRIISRAAQAETERIQKLVNEAVRNREEAKALKCTMEDPDDIKGSYGFKKIPGKVEWMWLLDADYSVVVKWADKHGGEHMGHW